MEVDLEKGGGGGMNPLTNYGTFYQVYLDWKSFGQQFIITLISYFAGVGLENNWTTNMDYNYNLRDLDLKILGL